MPNLTPDQFNAICNIVSYVIFAAQLCYFLVLGYKEIKKLGCKKALELLGIHMRVFLATGHLFMIDPDFYDRVSFFSCLAFMLTEGVKPTKEQFAQFDLEFMLAPLFDSSRPQGLKKWEKIMRRVLKHASYGECRLVLVEKRPGLKFVEMGVEYVDRNPFSTEDKYLVLKVFPAASRNTFVC